MKSTRSARPWRHLTAVCASVCAVLALGAALPAAQQTAPASRAAAGAGASRAGFSVERLKRVDALLQRYVDEKQLAGAVALVLRDGQPVYERAVGWSDKEANRPMAMDTIFRIASQTKAFTSAAVLSLIFLAFSVRVGLRERTGPDDTMRPEKQLFGYSVIYLFALFAALVADRFLPF